MKRLGAGISILLLCGCAGAPHSRGVFISGAAGSPAGPGWDGTNIALGRAAPDVWIAQEWTYRTDWPSVRAGVRLDDVTTYSEIQVDDQWFYDRFGGYYKTSETVRSGVLIR